MNTVVWKFISIVSGIFFAGAIGYLARKRNWLDEKYAEPMMFHTVIFGWTPASALVLWQLPLQWSLIALPVISAVLPVALAPVGYLFSKIHKLETHSAGTFIVACGISNIGFTMGGFVCYVLFGMAGLGYANLFAASWALPYVGFYYPLARRYGEPHLRLNLRFFLRTFFDLRSLPILGTIVGVVLNLWKIPIPHFVLHYRLIDILIIVSILLSFAIIGLQLHFSSLAEKIAPYFSLAIIKFIVTPVFILLTLYLCRFFFTLPPLAEKVTLVQSFMPTAIFTVIISMLFHLNARFAGALFLVNTAVFIFVVLPIIIFCLL